MPNQQTITTISATIVGASSLIIFAYGLAQAYTYDTSMFSRGAPPAMVMSGAVGLGLYLEVLTAIKFTKVETLLSTLKYRYFVYLSIAIAGFFAMCFYAAPLNQVEAGASIGAILWTFQSVFGMLNLKFVSAQQEKVEYHRGHCCGVGKCFCCGGECCSKQAWSLGCGMCLRWTLWVFALLFSLQSLMILSDNQTYLIQAQGTDGLPIKLVPVTSQGVLVTNPIKVAWFCNGTQKAGDPVVILEHGGGSGMSSMIPLMRNLVNTNGVRVCAYDRPGYGFSQSDLPYADLQRNTANLMEALEYLGEKGPYVCAGHSAGGTQCRNFQNKFPKNVTGLVFLDAYCNTGNCNIEVIWNKAQGNPNLATATYNIRLSLTDAMRMFAPFLFIRAFISKPGMESSNYGGNLAWNSQYIEFRPTLPSVAQNDTAKAEELWWTPGLVGDTPILVATAGAVNNTCEERKLVDNNFGKACTNFLIQQNATYYEVLKYIATSNQGRHLDCADCDHGYPQQKPSLAASYVMMVVTAAKNGNWSST